MRAARFFNALTLLAIFALLAALAHWQQDAWWPWQGAPDSTRSLAALLVVLGWLAFCLVFLWPRRASADNTESDDEAGLVHVFHASQTGFALQLAEQTAAQLQASGLPCRLLPLDALPRIDPAKLHRALVIASTTGEGDAPDHALDVIPALHGRQFDTLEYALLALGDRSYSQFCAFGKQLDAALRRSAARPLFPMLEMDGTDSRILQQWQQQLGELGASPSAEWTAPAYQDWTLVRRTHLNPGSPGDPVYLIELAPPASAPHWQAGDIAEIQPCHDEATIRNWLDDIAPQADAAMRAAWLTPLARAELPAPSPALRTLPLAELCATLPPLAAREYSIASIPAEGALQLLLRQRFDEAGQLGIASGWLSRHAEIGSPIAMRIRRNPGFHAPPPEQAMILIGNGTGIAGLRAHLAERVQAGARQNWLIFGERKADSDFHFATDLNHWQQSGFLPVLDCVFSRDGGDCRHVQDVLRREKTRLVEWIEQGACLYLCGSQHGMAAGVDQALDDLLGAEQRRALIRNGRYRRDVY